MSALFLPLRINADDARRQFARRRFTNLYGLRRRRPIKRTADGKAASLELVWMPAYAFSLELTHKEVRSSAWITVDACFGGFAIFERVSLLYERETEEACFPPRISVEDAEHRARRGMLRYVLRKRGTKPMIENTLEMRPYYAPVWVYYFYRFGKKIDIAILDGYTGGPMGGQMRVAIINAFIAQGKTDDRASDPESGCH